MKKTYYFSHDHYSRCDMKIILLQSKYGMEGFGIYWAIIEKLHENNGWLQNDCSILAYEFRVKEDIIKDIINSFDLFIFKDKSFSSNRVLFNLERISEKSAKAKAAASRRWDKNITVINAIKLNVAKKGKK